MKPDLDESLLSQCDVPIVGGERAEEAARAMPLSEVLVSSLLEALPVLMWAATPDGVPCYLNQKVVEYHGRSLSDFLRLGWADVIHPEDLEETVRTWSHAVQSGSSYHVKHRLRRADGEYRWFLTRGEPLRDREGRAIQFFGISVDIDESVKREAEICRLFDANIVGVMIWELEGRILEANDALLRTVGYERADLVSGQLRWTDLTPAEWRERDERALAELNSTGTFQPFEKEYFRKDGSRVPVLIGGAAFDEGCKRGVAFVVDLTERKRAEEELQRSEMYLSEAQRISHTGSWAWSPATGIRYWSEECYRVHAFDPARGLPSFESLIEHMHPADRPHIMEVLDKVAREKAVDFETEYRIMHADGAVRNIHALAHPVLGPSGDVVEYIGTVMDITERKKAEEALNAAKARFEGILAIAEDAIISVDSAQRVVLFNQGAEKVFGYARSEVIGKPLEQFLPQRYAAAHRGHIDQFSRSNDIARTINRRREVFGVRKNGEEFPAEASISKLDLNGEVVFTVILRDVTERRRAEEDLKRQRTYLDELFDLAPDAIVLTSINNPRNVRINQEFTRMFGYTSEEAVGRRLRNLIAPDDLQPANLTESPDLLAGKKVEREVIRQRKDGTRFHAHVTAKRVSLLDNEDAGYVIYRDITERKRAEEELRRSQHYLAEAQKVSHTGSWAWSPVSNAILYWSEECYRIMGYDPAQGLPSFESSFERIHPEDRPALAETIERAVREKADFQIEYRLVLPDGTRRNVRILSHPVLDASGKLVEFVGTVMDVTEQKRASQERRAHLWFLESMDRINRAMQRSNDVELMTSGVMQEALEIFACDRACLIYPCDPDTPTHRTVMEHASPEYGGVLTLGQDLPITPEWAEVLRRALHHPEAVVDPSLPPGRRERFRIASLLAIAVRPKGDRPYLFVVHSARSRPWTAAELRLFEETARRLGDALTSVLAHRNLLASEEELRRSQHYLAEAQRLSHIGSWAFNADGFGYWSPELFKIYGLDPGGKAPSIPKYLALVHPEDRDFVVQEIEKMLAGGEGFDFKKRIVRPDGAIRHVRCVGIRATTGGIVPEFVGTGMDVTEHELLTQELRRREAYLAGAQRLSHTGSFGWKPDTGEIIWSAETYRIFEYDRAVTPTIDLVAQRIHPEDRADFQSVIERASEGASDFEHAYRLLLPDGRAKHVHALAHATRDASGNREFVGAVTDMTDHKRAEESLRASEAYLAEAQRFSHTGSWAWSPDQDIRYWSEECYRVLSFDPRDGLPRFEEFFQRIHPDDQPGFRELIQTAIREKAEWEADYRIVHPDGPVRDVHVLGHPVLGTSGHLVEFVGTVIDVTDRKRAEEELRRSRTYLAEAQKVSHTGSWAWNNVTRENVYWSEECFRIHGRDPAQGPPSLEQILADIHPDDAPGVVASLEKALRESREWEAEYRLTNFADGPRTVRSIAHPVPDRSGRVVEYIGTVVDITKQKRAEQELRTSELERARAEHALRDAREQLAQASKIASLAELSASIAHEINQPLQAIVANGHASLRWLDATPPNIEKAIQTAKRVVRDGNAAAEVVSRIRALFKHAAPAKVDLDINKLIVQVRTLMADEIQGNGVSLETELGEDVPTIRADAVQIQQVIVNLVRNAIEAMAATMERPKPLWIRSRREGDNVVVDVQDHGVGLADSEMIFEPFITTKETGLGMGLAICRSIIEAHAGRIWAARNPERGVTFSFSLPIENSVTG